MADITRYQFLYMLHEKLKPQAYLEIGIQYGPSLALASRSETAIGIDPFPAIQPEHRRPNQAVFPMTSDQFFEAKHVIIPPVDLAFIDGMHLVEFVLRDYVNVQKFMRPGGVIVFDDVLPYNSAIADRVQPPGDWTGDVWKMYRILLEFYRLEPYLVDTWPTGTMVLIDVDPSPSMELPPEEYVSEWMEDMPVPGPILRRDTALSVETILEML